MPLLFLLLLLGPARAQATGSQSSGLSDGATEAPPLGERLNKHLELHALAILPVAAIFEPIEESGRGVWTQPVAGVSVTAWPWEKFYGTVSAYFYFKPEEQEAWMPDFTYELGYRDWRPYSFYFNYASYNSNRYPWRASESKAWTNPLEGILTAGWRFEWPSASEDGRWHSKYWAGGSVALHYVPVYSHPNGTEDYSQAFVSFGSTVTAWQHLFAEFRVYYYPTVQNPWDPDFTYSLGWMDWRPWHVTVRWDNYSGNRWPGRSVAGNGGFVKGALMVDFKFGF